MNVAGVAPAKTVTLSPTLKSLFSAVIISITTSLLFVGRDPVTNDHCAANSLSSHAAPKVGANPLEIKIVSPSTIFMNWAKPRTSPHAALIDGRS